MADAAPVETIEDLAVRYETGIKWLTEHDPVGAFFFWYSSGIRPHHPMPAQEEGKRAEYATYVRGYELWLKLDRKLLRLEKAAATGGTG